MHPGSQLLARDVGQSERGQGAFGRLLSLRNDLGLVSEEYDVDRGRMCGNFPQALTHPALIGTALKLDAVAGGRTAQPQRTVAREAAPVLGTTL